MLNYIEGRLETLETEKEELKEYQKLDKDRRLYFVYLLSRKIRTWRLLPYVINKTSGYSSV